MSAKSLDEMIGDRANQLWLKRGGGHSTPEQQQQDWTQAKKEVEAEVKKADAAKVKPVEKRAEVKPAAPVAKVETKPAAPKVEVKPIATPSKSAEVKVAPKVEAKKASAVATAKKSPVVSKKK